MLVDHLYNREPIANRRLPIYFLLLVLQGVGGLPSFPANNSANSKAIEQDFEWFDALAYPSLTKHNFVHVHVAIWMYAVDFPDSDRSCWI